jgi:hypothetical protein
MNELKEKTLEEFKYHAGPNDSKEILEMRYVHYENRRRKKLKIIVEYIKRNKQNLTSPKVSTNTIFNSSQQLVFKSQQKTEFDKIIEIEDALRTGNLS